MNTTEEIIAGMLKENTGTHFLDSGGAYGRHWQSNQVREFKQEPSTTISFKYGIDVTHNIFHWLCEKLSYDKTMDDLFHGQFLKEVDAEDNKNWLQLMEEFPEWLSKREEDCPDCSGEGCEYCDNTGKITSNKEVGGIYGEGNPVTDNSYNSDNLLSQTIQYTFFEMDNTEYVILQIHGGCDVRGGYTKPRVFTTSDIAIFDYARGAIYCTGEDHHPTALALKEKQERQVKLPGIDADDQIDFDCNSNWSTDDSVHWYNDGSCGYGAKPQLEKYDTKELTEEDNTWEPGTLCVDKENDIAYCPFCGGKLAAGF